MRVNAYIVAADPAWIEKSVKAYYREVTHLFVSYDRAGLGWSGIPTRAEECLRLLRQIDVDQKMIFLPGDFHDLANSPIENDTAQRNAALEVAGKGADWVLEIDTDEVVADVGFLIRKLSQLSTQIKVCWWPMRVVFKQIDSETFLEVCSPRGFCWYEHPGPIACRPGIEMICARVSNEQCVRFGVRKTPLQRILERTSPWHNFDRAIPRSKAIMHFSWARSESEMRRKVSGWGHSKDFNAEAFLNEIWLPAEKNLKNLRNFHPITPTVWPALRLAHIADER